MAGAADIVVNVITKMDASGLDQASGKMGKFQAGLKKATVPALAAAAAVTAFGVSAVNSASRLQQSMGSVDAVFGKNAGTVKGWAAEAADSIGLAKSEYGELASLIGSQLKNAGLPMDMVTKKTKGLIDMGADLAAMYGGTTAEAVEALSSALKGEFDPMEKYGASLSASKIAAEQAAKGTDKLTGKAADQAKVMATLGLITKQTTDAHGAAAREQDSVAAKAQQATANFENMKAELGTALLPAVAAVMGVLAQLAQWLEKNRTVAYVLIGVVAGLAAAVLVLNVAMLVMAANPVVLTIAAIVLGVALLTAGLIAAWKQSETFRKIVTGTWAGIAKAAQVAGSVIKAVWNAILSAGKSVFNWIKRNWQYLLAGFLLGPFGIAVVAIVKNFGKIKAVALAVLNWIKGAFRAAWSYVAGIVRNQVSLIQAAIRRIRETVSTVTAWIKAKFAAAWQAVKAAATLALSAITNPINAMKTAIDRVIGAVQSLISWLGKIKVPDLGGLVGKLNPFSAMAPSAATYAAPSIATRAASLATTPGVAQVGGRGTVAGGSTVNINVTGAVDPEATARQIRRILDGHSVRMGLGT